MRTSPLLAAAAILIGTAAPAALAPHAAAADPKTLTVAISQSIGSLNPFLGYFASDGEIYRLTYPSLAVNSAKDFSPVPNLAESWSVGSDQLTWTFKIRQANWSDGVPITARDAAFTYNLIIKDPDARTASGNFVDDYESVTAPDDRTLVIKTKKPLATVLANDVAIVPEHVWKDVKDIGDFKNDKLPLVGAGPFVLTDFKADEFITLRANKDYWNGAPKYDTLTFRYYKQTDAAVQALLKGEIDVLGNDAGMTPAQFQSVQGQPGITAIKAIGRRFTEITFNPGAATGDGTPVGDGHPALKDVKVRQAIGYAIDKQALVDRTTSGLAQLGGGYIPAIFSQWHWDPAPQQAMNFDPGRANQLLDEAGYARGSDGTRVGRDGKKLAFRFFTHANTPVETQQADFIKGWLKDIGIQTDIQALDGTALNDQVNTGKFDITFSGWGANPDPDFILSLSTCFNRPNAEGKGGNTDTFYCNPAYDALYRQQAAATDPARRKTITDQMQAMLYEQAPSVILMYKNALEAYRSDRWTGFQRQPEGSGVIIRQQGYWGFISATPVTADTASSSGGGGMGTGLAIGGGVVAAVAIAGGLVLVARRRQSTADERE